MRAMVGQGQFIEYAEVHGNMYGTSCAAVKAVANDGRVCILDIDVQGVRLLRQRQAALGMHPLYIFVRPPSLAVLEERLRGRGTETEDKVQRRMKNAVGEIAAADDPGLFDFCVTNDDLQRCSKELDSIVSKLLLN